MIAERTGTGKGSSLDCQRGPKCDFRNWSDLRCRVMNLMVEREVVQVRIIDKEGVGVELLISDDCFVVSFYYGRMYYHVVVQSLTETDEALSGTVKDQSKESVRRVFDKVWKGLEKFGVYIRLVYIPQIQSSTERRKILKG